MKLLLSSYKVVSYYSKSSIRKVKKCFNVFNKNAIKPVHNQLHTIISDYGRKF